jgi:hypothetical protein
MKLSRRTVRGIAFLCGALCGAPGATGGEAVLPVVADTSIAAYPVGARRLGEGSEQGINAGASPRLKIKRFENQPILRFDFSPLPAGAVVEAAELRVKILAGGPLNHVAVGSLHVPWSEGKGTGRDEGPEAARQGGACFLGPHGTASRWREDVEEGDFATVSGGNGGDATCVTRARDLGDGWWGIAVDPRVVAAAREHGQTLVLTDETGIFDGAAANIFLGARESGAAAPVLHVRWSTPAAPRPPRFREAPAVAPGPLAGSLLVLLPAAGEDGEEGDAVGYRLAIDGQEVPRRQVPRPARPAAARRILLRGLPPGRQVRVEVTAFDREGKTAVVSATGVTGAVQAGRLAEAPAPAVPALPAPVAGRRLVARLADGLTLYDPLSGEPLPGQARGAAEAPAPSRVRTAVRGEIVGFQLLVGHKGDGAAPAGIAVAASDLKGAGGRVIPAAALTFHREHFVRMGERWVADVLPLLAAGETFAIPSQEDLAGQRVAVLYADLLVAGSTPPGVYSGEIAVTAGGDRATCPLAVVVRDVTLPDALSFIVEMNAYSHADDLRVFHETYRLCHRHRLSYNVLGYGHTSPASFTTPRLNRDNDQSLPGAATRVTDWSVYDRFYGPLFSGEIARDLPRAGEPATHWYLPFHCSWPYPLARVNPSLWEGRVAPAQDRAAFDRWRGRLALADPLAEEHLDREWRDAARAVAREFSEHFARQGWSRTRMQLFNNHKHYFHNGSLSLWTMDEPQYGRDFRALDLQYHVVGSALAAGKGLAATTRADISRPQFIGDRMDRSLGLVVTTSGAIELYPRLIEDLVIARGATLWWYGGGGAADIDPAAYAALFLRQWSSGCDGGMPVYTTFGGPGDWRRTDPLRVVRFDPATGLPVASFRMKAYRHAQQLMELLNLLAARKGYNRWHLRDLVAEAMPVKMTTVARGPDDPGHGVFEGVDAAGVRALQERVVATLLAAPAR